MWRYFFDCKLTWSASYRCCRWWVTSINVLFSLRKNLEMASLNTWFPTCASSAENGSSCRYKRNDISNNFPIYFFQQLKNIVWSDISAALWQVMKFEQFRISVISHQNDDFSIRIQCSGYIYSLSLSSTKIHPIFTYFRQISGRHNI